MVKVVIDEIELDTEKSWKENREALEKITEKYGPDATDKIVEHINEIVKLVEPIKGVEHSKRTVGYFTRPYWLIWIPARGVSLPFIATAYDKEDDVIKFIDTYPPRTIPDGFVLMGVKVIKAVKFVR